MVESEPFAFKAALYWLDDAGHYLFRELGDSKATSKFVRQADVAAAFRDREEDSGWLSAGIVRCGYSQGGPWFVFSAPGQKVEMRFDGLERDDPPISVPIPRIVLVGYGKVYWMFALKTLHFDPDAEVCRAPFPNIYADGKICWGSTATPMEAEAKNARSVWEQFFNSFFNGDLVNDKARGYTDVRELLHSLAKSKADKFPKSALKEERQGIGRLVEWLIQQGG